MVSKKDDSVTRVLDEIKLRERKGEKIDIEEYLGRHPLIKEEVLNAYRHEEMGRFLLNSCLDFGANILSESDIDLVWDDIQRRLRIPDFQPSWAYLSLPQWIELAKKKPEIRQIVRDILAWIRDVSDTNWLPGILPYQLAFSPRSRRMLAQKPQSEDVSLPTTVIRNVICVGYLVSDGDRINLHVTNNSFVSDRKLFLELRPEDEKLKHLSDCPISIYIETPKNRFYLGDWTLTCGLIHVENELLN